MEEVRKIQIAPYKEDVRVEDNRITTDFSGGITYEADNLTVIYKDAYLIEVFITAIAMTSRKYQLQSLMNETLHLSGRVL